MLIFNVQIYHCTISIQVLLFRVDGDLGNAHCKMTHQLNYFRQKELQFYLLIILNFFGEPNRSTDWKLIRDKYAI